MSAVIKVQLYFHELIDNVTASLYLSVLCTLESLPRDSYFEYQNRVRLRQVANFCCRNVSHELPCDEVFRLCPTRISVSAH
jgi:hypothetical protein